jgi:hypothetical protein
MAETSGFEALRTGLAAMAPRWGLSESAELKFLSHSENTTFLATKSESSRPCHAKNLTPTYKTPAAKTLFDRIARQ